MRGEKSKSTVVGPSKPRVWGALGAGLITGAADDDPSGIATYSQAGAQFGFQLAWTLLLTYPLMVAVQSICARIGRTTGRGLAGNLREHYPSPVLHTLVLLLLAANTLNIGANFGAMGEAMHLLLPWYPPWIYIALFGAICVLLQIFLQRTRYVAVLKWLTLSLFAYFGAACVVHLSWAQVLRGMFLPQLRNDESFWLMVVAILGTTISPYLFFWQASQEVEDTKAKPQREPLISHPEQAPNALARIRLDTSVGMGFSNLVALAVMVTAGATLHASGVHQIDSAAQAAEALRPIAGDFAFILFSLGIIGTGLLSIPVLAGSAAYALGEARGWPTGLSKRPMEAKPFYAVIFIATLLGALANLIDMNPLRALVWSAVINGLVAVPVMVFLMLMARDRSIMREFIIPRVPLLMGWITTLLMGVASLAFIFSLFDG